MNKSMSRSAMHTFSHAIHGDVMCTQNELRKRYGLSSGGVSLLCSGKNMTHHGWSMPSRHNIQDKTWTIYRAEFTDGSVYIGLTGVGTKKRMQKHASAALRSKRRMRFLDKILTLGTNAIHVYDICQTKTRKNAIAIEKEMILAEIDRNSDKCLNDRLGHAMAPSEAARHVAKWLKGDLSPNYNPRKYTFVHMTHGTIITTMRDLTDRYKLDRTTMTKVCSGKRRRHHGWSILKDGVK